MKKCLSLMLALCLLAGLLSGCGKEKEEKNNSAISSPAPVAAATPSPTPAQTAKAVKINAEDGLNIRSEPSTDGEILGMAEDGSYLPLLIERANNGWYEVEYEGKSAYVSAEFAQVRDVTLEQYNRLKAGQGIEDNSQPESGGSSAPGDRDPQSLTASPSPSPTASPSSTGQQDNEDGE